MQRAASNPNITISQAFDKAYPQPYTLKLIDFHLPMSGGFNCTNFHQVVGVNCQHSESKNGQENLRVAVTKPHRLPTDKEEPKLHRVLRELNEAGVPHVYLVHLSDGSKISPMGFITEQFDSPVNKSNSEYGEFIKNNHGLLHLNKFKNHVVQILSKFNKFHIKNRSHGDVKPDNIIWLGRCLELIDLEDGMKLHPDGSAITPQTLMKRRGYEPPESDNVYDVKKYECYKVGATLLDCLLGLQYLKEGLRLAKRQDPRDIEASLSASGIHLDCRDNDKLGLYRLLYSLLLASDMPKNKNIRSDLRLLYRLICSLLQKDPAKRATLEEAMQSPFFGPPEVRKALYERISKENTYSLTIDGARVDFSKIKPNETFYLWQPHIKNIYQQTSRIEGVWQSVQDDDPARHYENIAKAARLIPHIDQAYDALKAVTPAPASTLMEVVAVIARVENRGNIHRLFRQKLLSNRKPEVLQQVVADSIAKFAKLFRLDKKDEVCLLLDDFSSTVKAKSDFTSALNAIFLQLNKVLTQLSKSKLAGIEIVTSETAPAKKDEALVLAPPKQVFMQLLDENFVAHTGKILEDWESFVDVEVKPFVTTLRENLRDKKVASPHY